MHPSYRQLGGLAADHYCSVMEEGIHILGVADQN